MGPNEYHKRLLASWPAFFQGQESITVHVYSLEGHSVRLIFLQLNGFYSMQCTSGASDFSSPLRYAICKPDFVFKIPFLPEEIQAMINLL